MNAFENQEQSYVITKDALAEERERLNATKTAIKKAWNKEVECYEIGLKQDENCIFYENMFNPYIFPYHKSCYLLIDMYLCLEGPFPYELPVHVEKSARRRDFDDHNLVDGSYLPNSAYAIWYSLVPRYGRTSKYRKLINDEILEHNGVSMHDEWWWIESSDYDISSNFSFLNEWAEDIYKERKRWFSCDDTAEKEEDTNECYHISPAAFEHELPPIESLPKGFRTKLLLKLLNHSMSELQRDHRLAKAVLLAMIEYKCFDGIEGIDAFRYFLLTVSSEFIHSCHGNCQQDEDEDNDTDEGYDDGLDHICQDFTQFRLTLSTVFDCGITDFRHEHGVILSALMNDIFDSCGWVEQDDLHKLVGWDDEDFTHAEATPLYLIGSILEGLNRLNYQFRCRAYKLLGLKFSADNIDDTLDAEIDTSITSHLNCTNTLLAIGESVLKRLKATPVTESIGSVLVTGLTLSFVEPSSNSAYLDQNNDIEGNYLGDYLQEVNCYSPSILDARRYADLIIHASQLIEHRLQRFKDNFGITSIHEVELNSMVSSFFLSPPSARVLTVVKGLFLRQLVETHEAGCGYGDFLVWSGAPLTPFEDMLYEHNMNFPNNAGYDESPLKNVETGQDMNLDQIGAMYDFSLLMFRRAWRFPWTPERQAIKTIALCAHRHGMPLDISMTVNSFLSRDWWPDERAECWLYECQIDKLQDSLRNEREYSNDKQLKRCQECNVAHACSSKHMKIIHREGHRRKCRIPPMREPNAEDLAFCIQILERSSGDNSIEEDSKVENVETCNGEISDNSDEDDWESIASDEIAGEPSKISTADIVLKYFQNKSYRTQQREEHVFANT